MQHCAEVLGDASLAKYIHLYHDIHTILHIIVTMEINEQCIQELR